MQLGFIGLGAMGLPMASNLIRGGFQLSIVPHRDPKPIFLLEKAGATVVSAPGDMLKHANVVILMLPSSKEVEEVILGQNGLIHSIRPGQIIIDMGTSYPPSTQRLAQLIEEKGAHMLDAPVSGGVKGAEDATLAIMVGGDEQIYERCLPIFQTLGKQITYIGRNGMGHIMKLINNLISLTNLAVLAETIPMAIKLGLNSEKLLEVLSTGSADSWMLRAHLPKVMRKDFTPGFKLALALKDLNLGLDLAANAGVALRLAGTAREFYQKGLDAGMGEENSSSIFKLFEKML